MRERGEDRPACPELLLEMAAGLRRGDLPGPAELGVGREDLAACLERAPSALGAPAPAAPPGPPPAQAAAFDGAYLLHTDGASRGNPGPAGAGAVLYDPQGREVGRFRRALGLATNNVAEYQALILGLTEAAARGISNLAVRLDSELIARQIQGSYKVRHPDLKPLHEQALALLRGFAQAEVRHVYRARNAVADELANQAIDQGGGS